jgi:hypothetical protein
VVFLGVLVSCNDRSTPPAPITGLDQRAFTSLPPTCEVGKIAQLALLLLPVPLDDPPFDLKASITTILVLTPTQLQLAQRLVLRLAVALNDDRILAKLRDPGTPSKAQVISDLLNLLFPCVQLAPPGNIAGAFTPGGGSTIIGPAGGTLTTRDLHAAIEVPAGTVTGDHLFTIAPQTTLALAGTCLGEVPGQYNQCYNYTVSPADPFSKSVTIGMCTLAPIGDLPATPRHEVHERLRIASRDKGDPTKIIVFDRAPPPPTLRCEPGWILSDAGSGVGSWSRLAGLVDKLTKPFRPTPAYAWDGCGGILPPLPDVPPLSNKTTIDPVVFATGFETGQPVFTTTGFWHRSTLIPFTNTAYPRYVSLAPGDNSNGALPAPFLGSYALWYAEDLTGNFAGPLASEQAEKSGGTSVAPNSGTASSPQFVVPNTVNNVWLTFQTWWEIESVNPSRYDLMHVEIEVEGVAGRTLLGRLNPGADPVGSGAAIPFTSGGFNVPPVWQKMSVNLSPYRGKRVRLHVSFNTMDENYNGFRGWILDDVAVKIAPQTGFSPSAIPVNATFIAPSGPPPARVWRR